MPRAELGNERTQVRKTIVVRDSIGDLVLPSTMRWRLDCVTTGQSVLGWQSGAAAASQVIEVPAGANVIINDANAFETKRLTVQFNWGTDAQISQYVEWDVLNNEFYT
jgi:hypothetical protein